ncbi:MAG: histidine kinase [Sphingomonas bacterium]|uniref:sensor histidine kinase n=1 Tax=Sphingomonas bacterium TaxID=1895847 RepID=UPI0026302CEE|nr:ATP-binding protein [Sphingomonas bacterium]MDB5704132.1 histidine kinase [Sphingomonas bacterium]
MTGPKLRAVFAAMLIALAMLTGAMAPARAQNVDPGTRFDLMVADAKATMLIDPAKTISKAKAAEAAAQGLEGRQRTIGVATAKWLQGEAYLRLNNVNDARLPIDQALQAVVSTGGPPTKLKGDILVSRGGLHTMTADVAAALSDYQQAHNIFRDIGATRSRAVALQSIALLYQEANLYENALAYFKQAGEVYQGDPSLAFSNAANRGVCLKELGRYAEAEKEFREALGLARSMHSQGMEVLVLRNIARTDLAMGKLDAADREIAEGSRISALAGPSAVAEQDWSVAAQAALQHGQYVRAEALIDRSFRGVDLTQTTLSFREAHRTAYDLFKKIGDEKQALQHFEALKRLDDKTSKLAASINTATAAARFDSVNQKAQIEKLRADELQRNIDFQKARARTQQLIFLGLGVASAIIVSMLAFGLVTIRRSRNEVRAANIDLAATNSALGKALAAKTEFLATTSHEIRTPLNGILGMTQVMLADRKMDAATRDRIEVVHGAGVSMRALVDDILDVAKMETGNMTIEHVPFDVKATLHEVSRMWEEQARARGIGFTLDLADCPDRIEGDAARLRQVTFNLLSNALKFTENGSISIRAAAVEDASSPRLKIEVADTGIGIPADKHEIIFESFRQVDAGTTRKFGGTGLGLAICRNLARAMDGDVTVRSGAGQGSVFTLDLPLVRAAEMETTGVEESMPSALLILDRNPITRSMLRAVLETRAGTVVFGGSVEEAVGLLGAGGVSKILIDDATVKASEDVSGALAALATAAREAESASILLWPSPSDEDRARFLAAGIDKVIAKPIAGAALVEALYPLDKNDMDNASHLVTRAA